MKTNPKDVPAGPTADFAALCASDVMQRHLITVQASDSLPEVERVFADAKVGGLPVLDEDGHILGVLSMKDLVGRYAERAELPEDADYRDFDGDPDETEPVAFRRVEPQSLCAGDLMTTEVASVAPNTSLVEVARKMVDNEMHRLLVVDRGRLVGLVSTMDLLRPLAHRLPARRS